MGNKTKTIWIINQYASTPETGMGGRHYYLARELGRQGYNVYLIGASYSHLLRRPPNMTRELEMSECEGFKMVLIKVPEYSDAHSKTRIYNWFLFSWRLQRLKGYIEDSPDAVLYSSIPLVGYLGAEKLAKHYKALLFFEVRDIWPLTLCEIGGYSTSHPFIRLLQWIEDRAYRNSEKVISNLRNSVSHMVARGMVSEKFTWIPNGVDLEEVGLPTKLDEKIENLIPSGKFIVGYAGTLGLANAMEVFIDAAKILESNNQIVFLLLGKGRQKEELINRAKSLNLKNVLFLEAVPKSEMQSVIAKFDICYLGWRKRKIYQYGIGANKIPEYLFSERPVLHSYSGGEDPIAPAEAGITVEAENPQAVADAVMHLYMLPESCRQKMGRNGKKLAIEQYDYKTLASKMAFLMFG